jgi:hypothetical protein
MRRNGFKLEDFQHERQLFRFLGVGFWQKVILKIKLERGENESEGARDKAKGDN